MHGWDPSWRVWLQHPYIEHMGDVMHNLYKQKAHHGDADLLALSVFHVVKFCAEKSFKTDNVWHIWILLSEVFQSQDPVLAFRFPKGCNMASLLSRVALLLFFFIIFQSKASVSLWKYRTHYTDIQVNSAKNYEDLLKYIQNF